METEIKWRLEPEALTHGTLPMELFGVNPRTIKGDAWWNRERQKAYASTDYHCIACGVHKSKAKYHQWLEAHDALADVNACARCFFEMKKRGLIMSNALNA